MRIGVDATCWQNGRGYGRHARALLTELVRLDAEGRYTFFMDSVEHADALPPQATVRQVRAASPTARAASANGHRSARDMWRMSRALSAGTFDVLLFPTVYSYVPVISRAKKIVMIHDVIAETYPQLTLPGARARLFWKAKVFAGRWQADAVVTVSDFSRRGIAERLKVAPERIFVVGEASDPVFRVLDRTRLSERLVALGLNACQRLIVYVGGFNPHKNLEALVAVFAKLAARAEFSDTRLVLVGEYKNEVFHSYFSTIRAEVERLGLAERVVFTGFLPDEELVALLNLATVCVLPSLLEGFGLPAVEAAACGCPVVATNASPLPDLLGEGGLYFDPLNREELEEALVRVLGSEDLRWRLRAAGLEAAHKLTWGVAARQMMRLMREVAGA